MYSVAWTSWLNSSIQKIHSFDFHYFMWYLNAIFRTIRLWIISLWLNTVQVLFSNSFFFDQSLEILILFLHTSILPYKELTWSHQLNAERQFTKWKNGFNSRIKYFVTVLIRSQKKYTIPWDGKKSIEYVAMAVDWKQNVA